MDDYQAREAAKNRWLNLMVKFTLCKSQFFSTTPLNNRIVLLWGVNPTLENTVIE